MSQTALILWGAGGHARVVRDAALLSQEYQLRALLVDRGFGRGAEFPEPIHTVDDPLAWLAQHAECQVFVAMGDNHARSSRVQRLTQAGRKVPVIVHPRSWCSPTVQCGAGTFLSAGGFVNAGSTVGQGCIVNTGAIVEHDCRLGDGCHIAPGAVLGGGVHIGQETLIGLGARVLPGVKIGNRAIIGAGSVVLSDVSDGAVLAGNPARVIREGRE